MSVRFLESDNDVTVESMTVIRCLHCGSPTQFTDSTPVSIRKFKPIITTELLEEPDNLVNSVYEVESTKWRMYQVSGRVCPTCLVTVIQPMTVARDEFRHPLATIKSEPLRDKIVNPKHSNSEFLFTKPEKVPLTNEEIDSNPLMERTFDTLSEVISAKGFMPESSKDPLSDLEHKLVNQPVKRLKESKVEARARQPQKFTRLSRFQRSRRYQ